MVCPASEGVAMIAREVQSTRVTIYELWSEDVTRDTVGGIIFAGDVMPA